MSNMLDLSIFAGWLDTMPRLPPWSLIKSLLKSDFERKLGIRKAGFGF